MNFTSFHFLFFFLVTLVVGHLLKNRSQKIFLLLASYYFYGFFEPTYLVLILLSTIWDYCTALGIDARQRAENGEVFETGIMAFLARFSRKSWLAVSVTLNLGLLGYFKYTNFGIEILNDLQPYGDSVFAWPAASILLPIGISFYTFQSMSYTIDVYRGIIRARKSFLDFSLYVVFFPQLVAGPIVRASTFLNELDNRLTVDRDAIVVGVSRIIRGFFRKLVLSDNLASMVTSVFGSPTAHHPIDIWIGSLAFGFQIYLDFAGYTDIARGVARLFGFEFEVNFLYPMAAANITDHWTRWHISLTTWLRDYLYIPLGGSRVGRIKTYLNIFTVWLFTGIWHGPAYHFVAWGVWQFVLIAIHRIYMKSRLQALLSRAGGIAYDVGARVLTIFMLIFGFIWFRAESMTTATVMQGRMFGIANLPRFLEGKGALFTTAPFPPPHYLAFLPFLMFLFGYDYFFNRFRFDLFRKEEHRLKLALLQTAMIFAIFVFSSPETPNFMYFQF